jgi:hypothetical protein
VVNASQPVYLQIVCVGAVGTGLFCFLSAIPPSYLTCNAVPTVGTVSFALVVTPLAVKTQLVLEVFTNAGMRAVKPNTSRRLMVIAAVAALELLVCIMLSATVPFMPTVVLIPPDVEPVSPYNIYNVWLNYPYLYIYTYTQTTRSCGVVVHSSAILSTNEARNYD